MTHSHLIVKTALRATKYSYSFSITVRFPHTEDCSNTDTVTYSNHNSESADSHRNKHLCQQTHKHYPIAEDAQRSFRPPGSRSVRPPVCLFIRHLCHTSVPRRCRHRNYACYEEGGEIWWLIHCLQVNKTGVILLTCVMFFLFILSHCLFFAKPYITCRHCL